MPRVGSSRIRTTARPSAIWRARPSAGCRRRGSGRPVERDRLEADRRGNSVAAVLSAPGSINPAASTRIPERDERNIVGDRDVHQQTLVAPVLGEEGHAAPDARRAGSREARATGSMSPKSCGSRPKSIRASSERPGPISPKPQDFAGVEGEADVADDAGRRSCRIREGRDPAAQMPRRVKLVEGPADHLVIILGMSKSRAGPLATSWPSRRTTMSSASSRTSARMCEM